jgi:hypothetical protein
MTLAVELQKPEYANLSNAERLEVLHGVYESVVGHIKYGDTLHLVSMLARGLRQRIEDCPVLELKNAFSEALHPSYLASPAYSINVGLPEIRGMLDAGLQAGVVTSDEHAFIVQLATYKRYTFADVTIKQVVELCNPELIADDSWNELEGLQSGRKLRVMLNTEAPAQTHISVQMSEDGVNWFHATALHGVHGVRPYYADLPYYGQPRFIRWRCEYVLAADVTVV